MSFVGDRFLKKLYLAYQNCTYPAICQKSKVVVTMTLPDPEKIEKIRQQYDSVPYPATPLEQTPKNDHNLLYINNLVTPYYLRNQKVIDTQDKVILDAGCGSGYTSLILALANPGAKIVVVDISAASIEMTKQRLQYHGFDNFEYHVALIEELPQLGQKFDLINCNEALYFFEDPCEGLQAMRSALKPEGIIRTNIHSYLQRKNFYHAQKLFKMMGLMDENPEAIEIEIVRETMKSLRDQVKLKSLTWKASFENSDQGILMNYLIQEDRGYTIPEMFTIIKNSGLEFINMVNWRQWNPIQLFKKPAEIPEFLNQKLSQISMEDQLHLFELFSPVHRLLDFWCGHPNRGQSFVPVSEWQISDWQRAKIHLHPQAKMPELKELLINSLTQLHPFNISQQLILERQAVSLDSSIASCLLPLWSEPQLMSSLVERWHKLRALNPVTLEPTSQAEAWDVLTQAITGLESMGYILVEQCL
jgi:2-polyprenyl-3-methyl-5-hydroxy-6-metoxy-1,4-benzoquinol methylase